MKNSIKIVTTVLLMGFLQTANAQGTPTSKDAKFGVKGGVNFSNMYTEDV